LTNHSPLEQQQRARQPAPKAERKSAEQEQAVSMEPAA
jgi:hypothetical protein